MLFEVENINVCSNGVATSRSEKENMKSHIFMRES